MMGYIRPTCAVDLGLPQLLSKHMHGLIQLIKCKNLCFYINNSSNDGISLHSFVKGARDPLGASAHLK